VISSIKFTNSYLSLIFVIRNKLKTAGEYNQYIMFSLNCCALKVMHFRAPGAILCCLAATAYVDAAWGLHGPNVMGLQGPCQRISEDSGQ
jgi:hypothetical protein